MGAWLTGFFVNWPILLGAAAAAIPVVLHLIYRRHAPRVRFGTLRFIRASAERTARRRRIEEWLLLLLRAGAIFLLAIALAGPVLRSARLGGEGDVATAIVMDNSYSMAAESEGRSCYARAVGYAREILSALTEGSLAVVVKASSAGETPAEEVLTTDRNRLADSLAASEVSIVQADLASAVARAEELLKSAPLERREVFVLTDRQKATWRPLSPAPVGGRTPAMIIVDCGPSGQANLAVTDLDVTSTRPAVGVPLTIRAKIRNLSGNSKEMEMALYVAREKRAERVVAVEPGAVTEQGFSHTFTSPGVHTGWVDVSVDDALALDNRRYFALEIMDRIRVAVVREREGALPQLDEGFFLIPALNPAVGEEASVSGIEPVLMLRSDLAGADLFGFAAMFLLNVPELTADEMRALAEYVAGGGGLVVFPGDEMRAAAWNAASDSLLPSEKGLLPARLGAAQGEAETGVPVALDEVDKEHPIFAAFGHMPATFFSSVQVTRRFELQVEHGSRARVLARLSDGNPFLVEKAIGRGKALMFCTAATAQWSNLPLRTLWLPLLHRITYHLAGGRGAAGDYAAGDVVRFPASAGRSSGIDVTSPDGTTSRASVKDGDTMPVFASANAAGIYRWRETGPHGGSGAFAVNPEKNARESDLAVLSEREVAEKMLAGRTAHFVGNAAEARAVSRRLRTGVSLSAPILLMVVALVIAESFFANRGPKARSGVARVVPRAATGI